MLLVVACDDEVIGFDETGGGSTEAAVSEGAASVASETDSTGSSTSEGTLESSSTGIGEDPPLGPPQYVAYGREAGLAVSYDDAQTWVDVPEPAGMIEREDLARGEERIVLVGGADTAVTFDGVSWEHADVDGLGYIRGVAYGSGGFVSVGLDHLAWSWDGLAWDDVREGSTDFDLVDVAYADDRFVAVGVGQMATSQNGQEWTFTTIGGPKLTSIAFGDGRFVAVGEEGRIIETQDGLTLLRDASSGFLNLGELHFCDDSFVVTDSGGFLVSPDADAWESLETPNDGNFACSGSTYVLAKTEGLFRSVQLGALDAVHEPPVPLTRVHATPLKK
ncbi:MAG: hypothetical protein ACE37F_19630 [Nannocystaceae bacterium]|nr:hypothetical protein [bacterium]